MEEGFKYPLDRVESGKKEREKDGSERLKFKVQEVQVCMRIERF